jgi:DNA-binding CsgD family transcriptional regulator
MLADLLSSGAVAAVAAEAPSGDAFGEELLDRVAKTIGFDVAYHGVLGPGGAPPRTLAAQRGFDHRTTRRFLGPEGATYSAELLPVKRAALHTRGVAVDSEVFTEAERAKLAYFREMMEPDGGRHAMYVLGLFRGAIVSVTMLGRTGSAFDESSVATMRAVVPVLGLAAAAEQARGGVSHAAPAVALSARERDLVDYVALGLTNAEIGKLRGTSPRTVRNQLSALYARLVVANRAELVSVVRGRRA